jgi:hypothetical protein
MLKAVIAALALSAAATAVSVAPAFAAAGGPQITVTVSCPKDYHAADHDGQLSCARDKVARHADHKARTEPKPAAAPVPAASPVAIPWHPWHQWPMERDYGWHGVYEHFWPLGWQRAMSWNPGL